LLPDNTCTLPTAAAEMPQLAAKVDADARKLGCTIPFADLLIGAAALHFGYAVGATSASTAAFRCRSSQSKSPSEIVTAP
jgi:hypothetical protein